MKMSTYRGNSRRSLIAALACFGLFYYPAALWGYRTGRRLGVVSHSRDMKGRRLAMVVLLRGWGTSYHHLRTVK